MGPQRLQLGSEEERRADPAVVERLLAHSIPHEVEPPLETVPQGEGEHPDQSLDGTLEPPVLDGRHERLRIRPPAERYTGVLELGAQVTEVVDLPVKRDHVAAARRAHRLPALTRQVQDCQAAMPEGDAGLGIGPVAFVVRPAMAQGLRHTTERMVGSPLPSSLRPKTGQPAHGTLQLPRRGPSLGGRLGRQPDTQFRPTCRRSRSATRGA